jgi:hypothetical protein
MKMFPPKDIHIQCGTTESNGTANRLVWTELPIANAANMRTVNHLWRIYEISSDGRYHSQFAFRIRGKSESATHNPTSVKHPFGQQPSEKRAT